MLIWCSRNCQCRKQLCCLIYFSGNCNTFLQEFEGQNVQKNKIYFKQIFFVAMWKSLLSLFINLNICWMKVFFFFFLILLTPNFEWFSVIISCDNALTTASQKQCDMLHSKLKRTVNSLEWIFLYRFYIFRQQTWAPWHWTQPFPLHCRGGQRKPEGHGIFQQSGWRADKGGNTWKCCFF